MLVAQGLWHEFSSYEWRATSSSNLLCPSGLPKLLMGLKELEDKTAGAVVSGWQSHDRGAQRNKCNQKQSIHTRTIVQTAAISWLPSSTLRSWRRLFLGLMDILRASSVSSQRLPSTSVCSGCSMHGKESSLLSFTTKNSHIHTTKVIARRVGKLNCLNPVESAAVLLCFFNLSLVFGWLFCCYLFVFYFTPLMEWV